MPHSSRIHGFTLVELVVTIAVMAIMVTIAYPGLIGVINAQRLSSVTNELIGGLQSARSEAIRRNARVAFCRSTNGSTCAGASLGTAWTNWVVLADSNGDGTPDQLLKSATIKTPVLVTSSAAIPGDAVLFRPDGLARDSASAGAALLKANIGICIVTKNPTPNARTVTILSGSQFTTAPTGTGTCAQASDPP